MTGNCCIIALIIWLDWYLRFCHQGFTKQDKFRWLLFVVVCLFVGNMLFGNITDIIIVQDLHK